VFAAIGANATVGKVSNSSQRQTVASNRLSLTSDLATYCNHSRIYTTRARLMRFRVVRHG